MTHRLSRLGFVLCTVFSFGIWAPVALGKGNLRTPRSGPPMKGIKVVAIKDAFALGAWSGSVRRAKGLAIDESGLDEESLITLSVVRWAARDVVAGSRFHWYASPVTPYVSPHLTILLHG